MKNGNDRSWFLFLPQHSGTLVTFLINILKNTAFNLTVHKFSKIFEYVIGWCYATGLLQSKKKSQENQTKTNNVGVRLSILDNFLSPHVALGPNPIASY